MSFLQPVTWGPSARITIAAREAGKEWNDPPKPPDGSFLGDQSLSEECPRIQLLGSFKGPGFIPFLIPYLSHKQDHLLVATFR